MNVASVDPIIPFKATPGRTGPRRPSIDEVHQEHGPFVWRVLRSLGVDAPSIEDVYQEVFVVVHRKLHTFNGAGLLTTWLYGICFRVAAGYRRRAHFNRESLTGDWSGLESATVSETTPERQLVQARQARQLEQILDSMPIQYRSAFVMFEVEGLTTEEIAQAEGVPVGTVYSRIYRARRHFARMVKRLGPTSLEHSS